MDTLPTQRACQIPTASTHQWLIEDLWSDQAVGILGGEPKCCKSFLALELAVSVASAAPCLRRFAVHRPGPVLLFPAEDALGVVRSRLEWICAAAQVCFESLPIEVITAPVVRLDLPADRQRLSETVQALRPRLLILDPMIRLHRVDENDASKIAALLSYLRELQRQFELAVVLVHHARKDGQSSRPGQALRGSSELHGWGDSNLYMRRRGPHLTLTTEHRAAACLDQLPVQLTQSDSGWTLSLVEPSTTPSQNPLSAMDRVRQALDQLTEPASVQHLRKLCGIRTATLCSCLAELSQQGLVKRDSRGYQLTPPVDAQLSNSRPIDPPGNGNGKWHSK